MTNTAIQMILYCAVLIVLAIPLGRYIGKVMNGEKTVLTRLLSPVENGIYKVLKINREEEMDWKKYAVCAGVFSVISLAVLWLILMLQNILPLNPEGQAGTSWHLGFNTAASFVTNTNWQAYSGESALSYFSQMIGLGVQNFVTPAVGGSPVRPDPRLYPCEKERYRKLLYGCDEVHGIRSDSPFPDCIRLHCIQRRSADLPGTRGGTAA